MDPTPNEIENDDELDDEEEEGEDYEEGAGDSPDIWQDEPELD